MGTRMVLSMQAERQPLVSFFRVRTLIGGGSADQWQLELYREQRNHLDRGMTREVESRDPLQVEVPSGYCAFQFHDILRGMVSVDEWALSMGNVDFDYSPLYFITGVVKTIEEARCDVRCFSDWGYTEVKKQELRRVIGLFGEYAFEKKVGTIWIPMANNDVYLERPSCRIAA